MVEIVVSMERIYLDFSVDEYKWLRDNIIWKRKLDLEVFDRMVTTDDTTVKMAMDLGVSTATIDRAKKRVRQKIRKVLQCK